MFVSQRFLCTDSQLSSREAQSAGWCQLLGIATSFFSGQGSPFMHRILREAVAWYRVIDLRTQFRSGA